MFGWSLLSSCVIAAICNEALTVTITVKNNCKYKLWPGVLTGGSQAQLDTTGFELAPGASKALAVPESGTAGRIWARTDCGGGYCVTGDCGTGSVSCNGHSGNPPVTLAEFTLSGYKGQDYYDVSNVDGFNVPLSITPHGGFGDMCKPASCAKNILCPSELAVKNNGDVVACKSACLAFNKPEYCCSGDYNDPAKCKASNYSNFFKDQCPHAYSYAYDDTSSIFTCSGGPNYLVTFCP